MKSYTAREFMKDGRMFHIFRADEKSSAHAREQMHTHDFIEIVYVQRGKMRHSMGGVPFDTEAGDLLFMNRFCTHAFECLGDAVYINVLFSPDLLAEGLVTPENAFSVLALTAFDEMRCESDYGLLRFFGIERSEIESLILSMLTEYEQKLPSWETVVGNSLSTLLIKMLRRSAPRMAGVETQRLWRELSDYIDRNLGTPLSLSELAERSFYNPSYFSRIFKEKFGVGFIEYVTKRRLEAAVRRLTESELSIDEIASEVGFSDRTSLHHAFVRHLGQTPADFRKGKNPNK